MSEPIQLLATSVEIESTTAATKNIISISKASEASIGCTAHGYSAGDIIVVENVNGMVEMNKRAVRVKSTPGTDAFVAEGLDSTDFTTYVDGGTVRKITAFLAFDTLTSWNFAEPQPNVEDVTTIHNTTKREIFGLDSAPTATFDSLAQPLATTIARVRAVSKSKADAVMRTTFQNGNVILVNTKWAGGRGAGGAAGAVAKSQISLKFVADEQWFAS